MRLALALFMVVLLLIALAGLGFGVAVVVDASSASAAHRPGAEFGLVAAFVAAALPFLIGTVALGALAIVFAIETSREDQVAALREGTALDRERLRREMPTQNAALASKRAREAAEEELRIAQARAALDAQKVP